MIKLLVALLPILVLAMLVILLRLPSKLGKISLDQETVKGAVTTCWKELGIDQDIGSIKERASNDSTYVGKNLMA